MTAIWQNDGTGWRLLAPTGFPDEQMLHDLVEETPRILPLAGEEAGGLLPLCRLALSSTARFMGTPFQCVITTPV